MADDDTNKRDSKPRPATGGASNVAPFAATGRGKPCPICRRPSVVEMRPFCSKRCADLDLNRWLGEAYRVPQAEGASAEEESADPVATPEKR